MREELAHRVSDGRVVVLDVRPRKEYLAGHIPGALSVPLDEIGARLAKLPRAFFDFDHGCAAYLFGCGGHGLCAVVDPREGEVDEYIAFARDKGMRITHVIDTHVHADHRSGGPVLAERTGAAYCLHRSADVRRPFVAVEDGEEIALGNTRIRVLHTPGHTPESVSLVVMDLRRGPAPWLVITGDTLFSGAVGRPDLPGAPRENALRLYSSLHEKLMTLVVALRLRETRRLEGDRPTTAAARGALLDTTTSPLTRVSR